MSLPSLALPLWSIVTLITVFSLLSAGSLSFAGAAGPLAAGSSSFAGSSAGSLAAGFSSAGFSAAGSSAAAGSSSFSGAGSAVSGISAGSVAATPVPLSWPSVSVAIAIPPVDSTIDRVTINPVSLINIFFMFASKSFTPTSSSIFIFSNKFKSSYRIPLFIAGFMTKCGRVCDFSTDIYRLQKRFFEITGTV